MISRRTFLELMPWAATVGSAHAADHVRAAVASVPTPERGLEVDITRKGALVHPRVRNRGRAPVPVNDVVVFEESLPMPPETALYGEGFQMLTQTAGTLGTPSDLSQYTDAGHYRIPTGGDARAYYGLLTLAPPSGDVHVFAFTSCERFSGRFEIAGSAVRAIIDGEGLMLAPGASWPLEELFVARGADRSALLAKVADRLASHHPAAHRQRGEPGRGAAPTPTGVSAPPTGWCSWYCFGPTATSQQILDNLDVIARSMPALRYVQIDDGYQRAMGDWLETGEAFGGSVRTVLREIKQRGFEPAIWVAPFIAEAQSTVFQEHPDWFIKDADGEALRSDRVTFGGWRHGPWYAVDGTHPGAQAHLERVFRTMRQEWGCSYFKLDATFWGAMHGGHFHDAGATRIEAYRRGMQAVRRGAGDAFLLGCNHPIWPSAGVIDGSRSSNDIRRTWDRIASTAQQNLHRNWQNGRLWWNDPDAVVLAGDLTEAECQFHATAIYATGGMVLSGDDLTMIPSNRAAMLRKLLPPTGVAATFTDAALRVGYIELPSATMICLFNWDDLPGQTEVRLGSAARAVTDFWTEDVIPRDGDRLTLTLPPRSARLIRVSR